MNILHMKYAVEVAKCGSINKAAERLMIGQPNLSRAIKELENSLGIAVFDRSAKGMTLTAEGETFMNYAKSILNQVDAVENLFKMKKNFRKEFSISTPGSSYICEAFIEFSKCIDENEDVEILYKEGNYTEAVENVLNNGYKLGIIRYSQKYDNYYKSLLEDKGLIREDVTEFKHIILMNEDCPLSGKEKITYDDLSGYTEIIRGDSFLPSSAAADVYRNVLLRDIRKKIYVFERCSRFEFLSENKNVFMWSSPIPKKILERFGLVQRFLIDDAEIYKDILIYHKNHNWTQFDKIFISKLLESAKKTMK